MLLPRADRVGLVEPNGPCHEIPEPLHVRLAEDSLRPAWVREGDDRPVDGALVVRLDAAFHIRAPDRTRHPGGIGTVERARIRVAEDGQDRAPVVAQPVQLGDLPGWRPVERALGGKVGHRPSHARIAPFDGHVRRAGPVRSSPDSAHEGSVLGKREHVEYLPLLEVGPHLDRQTRIRVEALRRSHACEPIAGIRRTSVPACRPRVPW